MLPFCKYGPMDRAERKALWFAILVVSLFIVTLAIAHPPAATKRKGELTILKPVAPSKPVEPVTALDLNESYRVVPDDFKTVDFNNFLYGVYASPKGKELDLTLYGGVLELPDDLGRFELEDVYYKDVTGDQRPDAIVRLSHVQCGGSCDGGSDLLYVYTFSDGKLKNAWQYETGSYAYGCGLKTLSLGNKQLVLQLFGRCPKQATEYPGTAKFVSEDLTFKVFEFDGRRFVTKTIEYIPEPAQNVKNYKPEIRIY
jgi:hypothetical protein